MFTHWPVVGCILAAVLFLAGCGAGPDEEQAREAWQASPHADRDSAAFTRWDRRGVIPAACARCHSTSGYHDFLGLDGSTPGEVSGETATGGTIECAACHNEVIERGHTVRMPSGAEVAGDTDAACLDCHQARTSGRELASVLADVSPDEVSSDLRLPDLHSNPSAATRYGTHAGGGYEYPGQAYSGFFAHARQSAPCSGCHDPHSQAVRGEQCAACHIGATTEQGRLEIRSSGWDFDGDRNTSEGMAGEIENLRERLWQAIDVYALRTKGLERIYYQSERPYFVTEDGRRYRQWTPRLLRAAYNYLYTRETGGYAHNPHYLLQLLHDSCSDLGANMVGIPRAPAN